MGTSFKIIHLRLAIAAADEVVFWQTVLLRHFVLFTQQLAIPWDEAEEAGSLQRWSWKEDPHPSTRQGDCGTQLQAAANPVNWGGGLFPTNFNPFMQPYATHDAVL